MNRVIRTLPVLALAVFACSDDGEDFSPMGSSSALAPAGGPRGAEKVTLYGPTEPGFTCPTGGNPVGTDRGFAILNTVDNNTRLSANVQLKKATPNRQFDVYVNQDPGDCPTTPTGTFRTNKAGNGGTHVFEARVPGSTSFWVSVVDQATQGAVEIYRSPAAVLD